MPAPREWSSLSEELEAGRGLRLRPTRAGSVLTTREVLAGWREDGAFRDFFDELLANAPFDAFYFETPAVTRDTLETPFELVLLPAPALAAAPVDGSPFHEHFERAGPDAQVVHFRNLGGDALLVVPCPLAEHALYAHLASFSRGAPRAQRQALWREVASSLEEELRDTPLWLSTAGGGVFWLHLRLDSRPKYMRHLPYRHWPRL